MSRKKKKEPHGIQGLLFAAANVERRAMADEKLPPDRLPQPKQETPARKRSEETPARTEEPAERVETATEDDFELPQETNCLSARDRRQLEREVSREYGVPLTVVPEPRRVCQQTSEVDKEERRRKRFSSD